MDAGGWRADPPECGLRDLKQPSPHLPAERSTLPDMSERVQVGLVSDFPQGWQGSVDVGGINVVVVNYQGQFYALRNNCTHKDYPLLGGEVSDGRITCTKHGGKFELSTGKAKALPAVKPVQIFRTEIQDGVLYVRPL